MKTHFLRGSKQEIVDRLVQISGEVCEAIVFEEEASAQSYPAAGKSEDLFAEMVPYMVDVQNVDDSREAIYIRMEGE
ncbi:MAG: hypothetical protein FJ267_13405 [Planctomycetes bacterium]|nr:hypothetical protein [Planctomycetota bacterium]